MPNEFTMTSQQTICFVIPYYKGIDYLEKTLHSLIAQKNPTWYAIVVDDCGGEDAELLVLSFNDSRINYVRNERNLGIGGNWNKAVSVATSDLVTILHSDDLLKDNYVEIMTDLMCHHPHAAMGHCAVKIIDANDQLKFSLPDFVKKIIQPRNKRVIVTEGDIGLSSLTRGAWIFCPTICYRRESLPDKWFDEQYQFVLDVDFSARMLLEGKSIVGTTEIAYLYRRHATNQTRLLTESDQRFYEEVTHLKRIHALSIEKGWHKTRRSTNRMIVVRLHMIYEAGVSLANLNYRRAFKLIAFAISKNDKFLFRYK
jgi:glycosyltransferase involved in cell wall biosynthesis